MNKIVILARIIILIVIGGSFTACQATEKNKWTPPKFVKEWEIKEIKPGLPHHIISMTANKNGIFVLVRANEVRYYSPKVIGLKKAVEMAKDEKDRFLLEVINSTLFSGSAITNMTNKERDELIDFVISHLVTSRKASEMTEKERDKVINFLLKYKEEKEPEVNKDAFKIAIEREGKEEFINRKVKEINESVKEEVIHYCIQQYDLEGNFIAQWPGENKLTIPDDLRKNTKQIVVRLYDQVKKNFYNVDSRDFLIKPLRIIADDLGMIYLADYEGNKIVKFNSEGYILGVWEITKKEDKTGKYDYLEKHKGMNLVRDNVYIATDANFLRGPVISLFDLKGTLIKERALPIPQVPSINPYEYPAKKHSFVKDEGSVNDTAVDSEGNIYLLAGMIKIYKYNKDFKEVNNFEPIVKEGFDTDIKIYDSKTRKYIPYSNPSLQRFKSYNTQKGAGFGLEVRDYDLDRLYSSPKDELFVTFKGAKPFGEIIAGIYNKDGKMSGYWKVDKKSNSEWFAGLPDIDKINAREMGLNLAFHENSIFVAKTIEIQPWEWENDRSLWSKTGALTFRSIIQRFDR